MRYIWQTFVLIALCFLIISIPSEAGSNEFADVEFFLSRDCIGENCNLAIEEPTSSRPKYWVAQNDPPVQSEYYPLATWEMNMGGPLELGDSYSYVIWVESTNVQEINFRTTLFITWIDDSCLLYTSPSPRD